MTSFSLTTQLKNWKNFSKKIDSKIMETSFGKIFFLFLPELDDPDEIRQHMDSIDLLVQQALENETISLIVAFSPWGERQEAKYLDTAKYPPHILLGSNSGYPVSKLKAKRKTLWVRPELWGASVSKIECYRFPDKKSKNTWQHGSVRTTLLTLDDSVPSNQKVLELIGKSR